MTIIKKHQKYLLLHHKIILINLINIVVQKAQLINIAPHSLTMLSTTNTKFSFIEVWFTDQNSGPLEIEDNVNVTLIIELKL